MQKQKCKSSVSSLFTVGLLTATLLLTSCSQMETRRDTSPQTAKGAKEEGDNFPRPHERTISPAVPQPADRKELRVAVILGPGGYKAFAHAGVLKELRKKNIPINSIVGLEWGSLVAGLYAQRGQVNEAEWKLYKLEKLDLSNTSFFSNKKQVNSLKVLDGFLRENLEFKDLKKTSVAFFCPSLSLKRGTLLWQDRGPLANAVSNCLAFPPLFQSQNRIAASLFSLDEVVTRLKQQGNNVIILVNVLGDGNLFDNEMLKDDYATALLWSEARRAIWHAKSLVTDVVEVNTRGVGLSDFDSRKLLVTAGEAAGERAAKNIVSKYGF